MGFFLTDAAYRGLTRLQLERGVEGPLWEEFP
jgi:hypothetical protein